MAAALQSVVGSGIPIVSARTCAEMIEPGLVYLFFCCGTQPPALVIRLVTGSSLSHTGFGFRDTDSRLKTIESTFTEGVHEGDLTGYINDGDGPFILCAIDGMTPELAAKVLASARSLIGRRYEVGEEIEMLLHHFDPLIAVHAETRELFCSGEVGDALNMLPSTPWPVPNDATGGNPTPADIWNLPFVKPLCAVVDKTA